MSFSRSARRRELGRHGVHRGDQTRQLGQHGEADGGGDGVVGRLPHVDVVVGVDRLVGAFFTAQRHVGEVGDDFVAVHVVAGAGAGLKAVDDKLVEVRAADDFFAGGDDGVALVLAQPARLAVGARGGQFDANMR